MSKILFLFFYNKKNGKLYKVTYYYKYVTDKDLSAKKNKNDLSVFSDTTMRNVALGENPIYEVECHSCGYIWFYKGNNSLYATCPNCHYKVNLKKAFLEKRLRKL